ncbi:helix-turn-helix domain-containing protein [Kribbella sp. CA-293567]|uniref:helix-turn-helix domain-containing protein n=1 Tax=Kribbella sp. CA-293567 TaxID=3002436 RepID=UPI0022DD8CBB|nr:helix-turn-helix domain-containing protein [Kribbella sp. CA-293567]WBQ05061.1 helix-turn-helix domain-containing protein [Kribbella sp. CA-293567]
MTFGDRLREYRQHRGRSLADLSKATHHHRSYLSNLENGRKIPSEDLARVCDEVLRAKGELIAAARGDTVSKLDQTPWQTAELIQRMQASDTTAGTLESLHSTVEELCCQYNHRDALELRQDAHSWLQHVAGLLRRPVGLKAHADLLVAGGWLALLAGCVEYDVGMRTAAESTRTAAMQLGLEAGHPEIAGWGHEMTAWFALTQGRFRQAVDAAQRGQAVAQSSNVHVQLIAQEAKARARLGESDLEAVLENGKEILNHLPYPDRPDNHFKIDPAKWDYHAMDVHRIAGDDDLASQYARAVISDNITPDGHVLSPMRVSECRITLGIVAGREGDLEQAVSLGLTGLKDGRQSKVHLRMIAGELEQELRLRFPSEGPVSEFEAALRAL